MSLVDSPTPQDHLEPEVAADPDHSVPSLRPPSHVGPVQDPEDVFEVADRSPLQALAGAYADRLAAIRAGADARELADSAALVAGLERLCLRSDGRRVREL